MTVRVRRALRLAAGLALLAMPVVASPAVVTDCAPWASADTLVEPWERTSRIFARGSVRLALVDLGEPPCCPVHLVVLMPANMYGGRVCALVARNALVPNGWTEIGIDAATATRTEGQGLRIEVPVFGYDPATGGPDRANALRVTLLVRQGAGTVVVEAPE